jgi:hypothetical protein
MNYICQLGDGKMLGTDGKIVQVIKTGYPLPDCEYNGVKGQVNILTELGVVNHEEDNYLKCIKSVLGNQISMPFDIFIDKVKGLVEVDYNRYNLKNTVTKFSNKSPDYDLFSYTDKGCKSTFSVYRNRLKPLSELNNILSLNNSIDVDSFFKNIRKTGKFGVGYNSLHNITIIFLDYAISIEDYNSFLKYINFNGKSKYFQDVHAYYERFTEDYSFKSCIFLNCDYSDISVIDTINNILQIVTYDEDYFEDDGIYFRQKLSNNEYNWFVSTIQEVSLKSSKESEVLINFVKESEKTGKIENEFRGYNINTELIGNESFKIVV